MRKFTLFLAIAMVATLTFAQAPLKYGKIRSSIEKQSVLKYDKLTAEQRKAVVGTCIPGKTHFNKPVTEKELAALKSPMKVGEANYPEVDLTVISEQPEGELKTYVREGGAFMNFWGYVLLADQNGQTIDIVTASDGKTVYLKDPVSQGAMDSWVKGTLEGNKIHVPLYQCTYYSESYGYGYMIAKSNLTLTYDEEEDATYMSYEADFSATEVTFTINDNGVISLDDSEIDPTTNMPSSIFSLIWTDDFAWAGIGDYQTVYTLLDAEPTLIPEGVEPEKWSLMYSDGDGLRNGKMVNVYIDGDKFYMAGLSDYDPESAIVGTISGDKVTFASDQYLGNSVGYVLYYTASNAEIQTVWDEYNEEYSDELVYDYLPELVMSYDAENKILNSLEKEAMVVNLNKGSKEMYVVFGARNPKLEYFVDVPATPADPEVLSFNEEFDTSGFNFVNLNVKLEDVNGNFIDPAKTSYILWTMIDGEAEPFVFYADEYYTFANDGIDELTEVPYNFVSYDVNGYIDISTGGSTIYLYQTGFDDYGVQTIYNGGGERRESNISWYSVTSGINGVTTNTAAATKSYFSLDGKRLAAPQKGINIVKMSDGTVRKVIVK